MRTDPVARFWAKVDKSGECWIWQGAHSKGGYGLRLFKGCMSYTHRIAYTLTYGVVPDDLDVLHRCDVRDCVRPDHLFLGTHADNMADMAAKGRHARGQQVHGPAKLSDADAVTIKRRLAAGEVGAQLAREYGVTRGTISHIRTGHTRAWQNI